MEWKTALMKLKQLLKELLKEFPKDFLDLQVKGSKEIEIG
jgi:hypothetical protein